LQASRRLGRLTLDPRDRPELGLGNVRRDSTAAVDGGPGCVVIFERRLLADA
jgi:hypothetical protein